MAEKKTDSKKKKTSKVKYIYGTGDDGWGIHNVKNPTPAKKTTKKK